MAKAEWGLKRTCLSCGARFYDLQREPIGGEKGAMPVDETDGEVAHLEQR